MRGDVHLRDLRYFVVVAEELHFTRAAERLFVAQPSLSRQIRRLEAQIGTALLERDRRTVALTEAGQALLPAARDLVEGWDAAAARLREVSTAATGRLRVGMSTALGRGLLPRVRVAFTAARPDAGLVVRQVSWDDPTADLAEGRVDVEFLWLPLPTPDDYRWILLAEEPRLPAAAARPPPDRPQHRHGRRRPGRAVARAARGVRAAAGFWLGLDERRGHPVRVAAEISATDETLEALTTGVGVCFIAVGNAPAFLRDGVTAMAVEGLSPSRLVLAWRRDDRRELVRDFVAAAHRAIHRPSS